MHPKLLESTIQHCRDYMAAGDCPGEAPPTERLIDAVVQLAGEVRLSPPDVAFLAARLRRLAGHFNYPLPKFAADDSSLIGIAGSVIGAILTNVSRAQSEAIAGRKHRRLGPNKKNSAPESTAPEPALSMTEEPKG